MVRRVHPDDGSTHWTTRTMTDRHGIGKDTVARIWRKHHSSRGGPTRSRCPTIPISRRSWSMWSGSTSTPRTGGGVQLRRENPGAGHRARWHPHFTPTSASWLNLVEGWFSLLTKRRPENRRRFHARQAVSGLENAIDRAEDETLFGVELVPPCRRLTSPGLSTTATAGFAWHGLAGRGSRQALAGP